MVNALHQLIRDAFADAATDIFLIEDEPPRIRRDGDVLILHPGPIPRGALEEFWKSCGVDSAATLEMDISWNVPSGGRFPGLMSRMLSKPERQFTPSKLFPSPRLCC